MAMYRMLYTVVYLFLRTLILLKQIIKSEILTIDI